ncbi:hypothetical protein C4J98_1005 [Pseudomonas orientalis]|nr:hypothetical protein C4J98_1005 [Pseudomonas orientalis]
MAGDFIVQPAYISNYYKLRKAQNIFFASKLSLLFVSYM